ncbi:MAG: hypothetical protein QXT74_02330 [Candidatus Nezhaarchaeales archaeon]
MSYRTRVPAVVLLDSGEVAEVGEEQLRRGAFRLFAPRSAEEVRGHLARRGFVDVPSLPKGEEYSMAKEVLEPWELHVRLYRGAGGTFLEGEVEVSRRFVGHLSAGARAPVVYEVCSALSGLCDEPLLQHKPSGRWVAAVLSDQEVVLHPPPLTKWSTLALAASLLVLAGLFGFVLRRLWSPPLLA